MKSINNKLALATCTLLGGTQQAQAVDNAWDLDSSFLYYSETNDRVSVSKMMVNLSGDLGDNDRATIKAVLDTMSGATPTGAVKDPSSSVSFTSASGAGGLTATGGAPDTVNFSDTRLAISMDWDHSMDRLEKLTYGGSVSIENDYQSFGASINYTKDTSDRITTYSAGFAYSYDKIFQTNGGTPDPLSNVEDNNILGDGERFIYDSFIGMTKVLNKKTVAKLNFSLGYSDGYHTDPYKVISQADVLDNPDGGFWYIEMERFYESRPESRLRSSIYTSMAHQYGELGESVQASYRYYADDWGINAHTVDITKRRKLEGTDSSYYEPHFRYHIQSAADFFKHSFSPTDVISDFEHASADYRLDAMQSYTLGVKYGQNWGGGKLRMRVEYLSQFFEDAVYDRNSALVFQVSYNKQFY